MREGRIAEQPARSARSAMVSAMIALLSVLSPLSPRAIQARNAFSRRSRRDENCRNGSTLERCRVMTCLPFMPRSSAAAAAASRTKSGRPGEIGLAVELHRVGLLVGQHVLAERGAERRQPLDDGRRGVASCRDRAPRLRGDAWCGGAPARASARRSGRARCASDRARRYAPNRLRASASCSSAPRCGARCRARSPAAHRCCRCWRAGRTRRSTRCKRRPAFSSGDDGVVEGGRGVLARDRRDLGVRARRRRAR